MFFHCARLGRLYHGGPVLFRKSRGQDNLHVHHGYQMGLGITIHGLADFNCRRVDTALLAERKHVEAGTGAQRSQKKFEGRRGAVFAAAGQRLIGLMSEAIVCGVHSLAAGKINFHVHNFAPELICTDNGGCSADAGAVKQHQNFHIGFLAFLGKVASSVINLEMGD